MEPSGFNTSPVCPPPLRACASAPTSPGLGPFYLGQLLAESQVLLAELTERPRPLSTTVLLL